MKSLGSLLLLLFGVSAGQAASSVHEFTMNNIDGKSTALSGFRDKVILFVNVASKCGYTPQYSGLQALYEKYKSQGFVIVGVPANNFGQQEPGSDEEIKQFCSRKFNVTFPMLAKVSVKGEDKAPLYQYLTDPQVNPEVAGDIRWNFTKILVGKDGRPLARFEPNVSPDSAEMAAAIEKALQSATASDSKSRAPVQ